MRIGPVSFCLGTLLATAISVNTQASITCNGNWFQPNPVRVGTGGFGDGTLLIDGGSVVTATDGTRIAVLGSDSGTVTVSGPGSQPNSWGGTTLLPKAQTRNGRRISNKDAEGERC